MASNGHGQRGLSPSPKRRSSEPRQERPAGFPERDVVLAARGRASPARPSRVRPQGSQSRRGTILGQRSVPPMGILFINEHPPDGRDPSSVHRFARLGAPVHSPGHSCPESRGLYFFPFVTTFVTPLRQYHGRGVTPAGPRTQAVALSQPICNNHSTH